LDGTNRPRTQLQHWNFRICTGAASVGVRATKGVPVLSTAGCAGDTDRPREATWLSVFLARSKIGLHPAVAHGVDTSRIQIVRPGGLQRGSSHYILGPATACTEAGSSGLNTRNKNPDGLLFDVGTNNFTARVSGVREEEDQEQDRCRPIGLHRRNVPEPGERILAGIQRAGVGSDCED